jgi:hypothetical protein
VEGNGITHVHGEQAFKLSEDHLLPCLSGDGLQKEVRGCARVQVLQEPVHSGLAPTCELRRHPSIRILQLGIITGKTDLLAEVNKLANGLKIVLVFALLCALVCGELEFE